MKLRSLGAVTTALSLACALVACSASEVPFEWAQVCDPAPGKPPACSQLITTAAAFDSLSVEDREPFERATKYLAPVARDAELLPPLVQNVNLYQVHWDFLPAVFAERFPTLTLPEYAQLVQVRATRKYYAGDLRRIQTAPGETPLYGFGVYRAAGTKELLELRELQALQQMLAEVVQAGQVAYLVGDDPAEQARAQGWLDPGFPVYFPRAGGMLEAETYTPAVSYGRVRLFSLAELNAAVLQGQLSWQDIVVVERVPFDLEQVVAGVITGERQWQLSHVNVRMARRGTPNLYLREATAKLKAYAGRLMRLEARVGNANRLELDSYSLTEATVAEAETWWAAHRPQVKELALVDPSFRQLQSLRTANLDGSPLSRIGGKAGNLARLYRFLPAQYQVPGFAIPCAWFEDFMQRNTLLDQRVTPPERVSYRQYIERLAADAQVSSDAQYRRQLLWDFRERARAEGQLPPGLAALLVQQIKDIYGSTRVKVRFRSSSNIEDALEFSGAGLYSSISVCADDSLDEDRDGPSRCDATQNEEHTIERGLKEVWTSLYNARAWEERQWYQVAQTQASMGILVTEAFTGEDANGVAFTGDPNRSSPSGVQRFLVNVQLGEEAVVGNDPLIIPETDYLDLVSGTTYVTRVRSSSLAAADTVVLSDEELSELGRVMQMIDKQFPLELGEYRREQVLLDLEFKLDGKRALKIKQIRPFLLANGQGDAS